MQDRYTRGDPRPQDAATSHGAKHISELLPAIMARIAAVRDKARGNG
jgi:hypothetical protein